MVFADAEKDVNFRNSLKGNRRGMGQIGEKERRENKMGEEKKKNLGVTEYWSRSAYTFRCMCIWMYVCLGALLALQRPLLVDS